MAHVEGYQGGRLVPFFALCLFAGIRPCLKSGEIFRLKPEHIRLDDGFIAIDGTVSKVGEPRKVIIQPNLAAWLRAYPLKQFPIVFPNLQRYRAMIAKKFAFSHDIMRHTFLSMFISKFRSIGEAALQAGNSEGIIRKHYLDLKDASEAERFFGIFPQSQAAGAVLDMPILSKSIPRLPVAV
jgi:integrase